jgi:hypothetical protein
MGPGTHIQYNIENYVKPINATDALAMVHDINYMLANDDSEATLADNIAIAGTKLTIPDSIMRFGLTLRKWGKLPFYGGDTKIGLYLKNKLLTDPNWRTIVEHYGINNNVFIK